MRNPEMYRDYLKKLTEEDLVAEYTLNFNKEQEYHARLLYCEDEHSARKFGNIAIHTFMNYQSGKWHDKKD